jgi:hypothetical protein
MSSLPHRASKPRTSLLSITALFREPKAREDLQLDVRYTLNIPLILQLNVRM